MTITVSMKNNVPAPPNHVLLDWALAKNVKQAKETGVCEVDHRIDMERAAVEQENRYNSNMQALMHKLSIDRRRRRVLCVCALVTLLVTIAVAMGLMFGLSSSDDSAAAEGTTSKSKTSPFIVMPLNTTEDTPTRAAEKCAERHSWLDSMGLCGVVGTVQNWFGWGDNANPYDSLLANDNPSIGKDHLCVMPCSDGSGDFGVCLCGRNSPLALLPVTHCVCPPLGRSVVADSNSGTADDDSGLSDAGSRAMNLSPNDGYIVDDDDDDSTPLDQDSLPFDDDSDEDSSTNPDSSDTSDLTDGDDDETYMYITDEKTGTSCLLHCPHLTHFQWPGETRRVFNCREYAQQMTPDLCDVVDS